MGRVIRKEIPDKKYILNEYNKYNFSNKDEEYYSIISKNYYKGVPCKSLKDFYYK